MVTNTKKEFAQLSWQVLEHRVRYYHLDAPIISDYDYDMMEKRLLKLGDSIGIRPLVADMVGIDLDSPAVQAAIQKVMGQA